MRVIVWRVLAALAIVMVLSANIVTAQRSENRLSGRGRELLAQARAEGKATVTLLVAADPRAASAVAATRGLNFMMLAPPLPNRCLSQSLHETNNLS